MKSKYNKMLKMEKVSDLMKWAHGCLIILLSHLSKYFFFFLKHSSIVCGMDQKGSKPIGWLLQWQG